MLPRTEISYIIIMSWKLISQYGRMSWHEMLLCQKYDINTKF